MRSIASAIVVVLVASKAQAASTNTTTSSDAELDTTSNAAGLTFSHYLLYICGALVVSMVAWRVTIESTKYVRLLACLNNSSQRYFARPSPTYATFKAALLYAPVFRKRHNREFQLSAAINVGTLPTRLQLLFLMGYLGTNAAFCVISIQWDQPFVSVSKELRNRTGILALVNMIPLFIMSARNNPLINWLNMSYDTFNLLHRWFGRIVVLEALLHTGAWMAGTVKTNGWAGVMKSFDDSPMIWWGLIGAVTLTAMSIQAMSIIRHAFYEIFKFLHIILAIASIVGIWIHLRLASASQVQILMGVVALWAFERITRILRIMYRNLGAGGSRAAIESLPGNAVRVTADLARPWKFQPGQHAFLYMPSIGLFTSHPFSVAWTTEAVNDLSEKESFDRIETAICRPSISFVVRGRTGFTNSLIMKAAAAPGGHFKTKCFVEGPYGGLHKMHSYGTVMLFAGGIGITHQVPHVRDLVQGFADGTVAARKVVLVWVIQSPEHLEWIRPWMTSILSMPSRREVLRIMLFVSRPRSTNEIHSPSATVQMFPGRPNIETLIDMEMENQVGAMGISVCGSGSLSDDVRAAVRSRQHVGNLDFVEESFSW